MKVAAPPGDLPLERLVIYQGDILNYSRNPQKEETDRHSQWQQAWWKNI